MRARVRRIARTRTDEQLEHVKINAMIRYARVESKSRKTHVEGAKANRNIYSGACGRMREKVQGMEIRFDTNVESERERQEKRMKKKKESSVYVLRGINGRERGGETEKKRDSRPPPARAPGSGRALHRSPLARCGGLRQSPLGRAGRSSRSSYGNAIDFFLASKTQAII